MPLPTIVETLLATCEYPGGPHLCVMGSTDVSATFIAQASVIYTITPAQNQYSLVIFEAVLGPFTVPSAFWNIGTQFGARSMCHMSFGEYLPYYIQVTQNQPWTMFVWNVTNISQAYRLTVRYLIFSDEGSYEAGMAILRGKAQIPRAAI
jgi:hypothetical protein